MSVAALWSIDMTRCSDHESSTHLAHKNLHHCQAAYWKTGEISVFVWFLNIMEYHVCNIRVRVKHSHKSCHKIANNTQPPQAWESDFSKWFANHKYPPKLDAPYCLHIIEFSQSISKKVFSTSYWPDRGKVGHCRQCTQNSLPQHQQTRAPVRSSSWTNTQLLEGRCRIYWN